MRAWITLPLTLAACASTTPGSFFLDPERSIQRLVIDDGTDQDLVTLRATGTRDIGGVVMPELTLANTTTGADVGLTVVVDRDATSVSIGGFSTTAALNGVDLDITLDTPVVLDVTAPIGEPQAVSVEGTITIGTPGFGTEGYLPTTGTYTVQSHDAVAPAPMGAVPGCHEVTFEGSAGPFQVSGTLWGHDDLGFVHAELSADPFGTFSAGSAGYVGWEEVGNTGLIQAEGVVSPDAPSFTASTTREQGIYDADKNVHAKMYLELRWLDETLARTTTPPPVDVLFSAGFGTFPHTLVQADTPYLHPEEADQGYVWWLAFVDEAAKNDPSENPFAFSVSVTHNVSSPEPVKVGAFLAYGIWRP